MTDCWEGFIINHDDDLSEESSLSVYSESDVFIRQYVREQENVRRCDCPPMRHEFIHWIRNEEDPISILLSGTRHPNSPLSFLRGLEDTVFEIIITFAVSPCNCCRDGPVAFCCRRQQKCLIDRNKEPRPVVCEGEVPDEIFLYDNVLMYEEGLRTAEYSSGCVEYDASSCKVRRWSAKYGMFLALTDTSFFYDYYNGVRRDCDYDVDFDEIEQEQRFRLEWNRSTHVIVETNEGRSHLSVEMIKLLEKESDNPDPAYLWLKLSFYLPLARIRELADLIQEKRRAVLDSGEYKQMIEYIS